MKTIKQVEVTPIWLSDEEFMPKVGDMEEFKIYISKRYGVSCHRCLCGCGELTVLPFGEDKMGWNLTEKNGKITFTPSVGNFQISCKSHYIITNNKANFV